MKRREKRLMHRWADKKDMDDGSTALVVILRGKVVKIDACCMFLALKHKFFVFLSLQSLFLLGF